MNNYKHILTFEPVNEPIFKQFEMSLKHTKVKIYVPKILVKGKKKPTIAKGARWYVYFYFKNQRTGVNKKYKFYVGINRIDSVKGRLEAAKYLKRALEIRLAQGYMPPDIDPELINNIPRSVLEAILFVQTEKMSVWGESTAKNNNSMIAVFVKWLKKNQLDHTNIRNLSKRHIAAFLSYLMTDRKVNNISRNNYRRVLSSLFKELVVNEIIDVNFVENIPKLIEKPIRNKAFTTQQLLSIKKFLLKNDPYLHKYLQFVTYAFLRPVEVCRIKIGDIDTVNNRIFVKTKTESVSIVRIIDNLKKVIDSFNIGNYKKTDYLFTYKLTCGNWPTKFEKARTSFFIRRFKKVKKHFKFGNEYGIYSFRHSFALDLYNKFIADGLTDLEAKQKLMTITRHKTLSSLEKYLRNIGAFMPKDYSKDYSIDF